MEKERYEYRNLLIPGGGYVTGFVFHGKKKGIFRSHDYGESWEEILHDLDVGRMDFRASYMKPRYNGGHSLIHWLTDLKIAPFDENEAWFNTGTSLILFIFAKLRL